VILRELKMIKEKVSEKKEAVEEQLKLFPGFVAFTEGKDELNIAEFPIAALANRLNSDIKTITYEDEITDAKTGELVPRKLVITGSDEYGLPTSFDDEVILGLLNLSRMQGFMERVVTFNRHQIIAVLGWSNQEYYYDRIKESINRWLGVSLYYDNAWRDKGAGTWKSGGFHLVDNVNWGKNGEPSTVTWNEKIFESFKQGNLKSLDLETYRKLHSPTARRIYRFLDKRFFQRTYWKFDLSHFAYNKIGLSRTAYKDMAQLKRQLKPAIEQLEAAQIIMPCSVEDRFTMIARGKWKIHFQKFSKTPREPVNIEIVVEEPELESKLVFHGVGRTQARRLLSQFDDDHVKERLEWLDYRIVKKDTGGIKSIPAYLVSSITDTTFTKPDGFKSEKEKADRDVQKAVRAKEWTQVAQREEQEKRSRQEVAEGELRAAEKFYENLPEKKQSEIRKIALDGCMFDTPSIRKMLVFAKVAEMLKNGELTVL
jgi:hypothetical protein